MLKNNYVAQSVLKKMGFIIERIDDETVKGVLNLKEEYEYERTRPITSLTQPPTPEPAQKSNSESDGKEQVTTTRGSGKKSSALKERLNGNEQIARTST